MDGTELKTIAVIFIIIGCFVVLFPKLFYPLVLTIFNLHRTVENSPKSDMDGIPRPIYEAMNRHDRDPRMSSSFPRMGSHPGMHAASEMKKMMVNNRQSADSKGTLGYVLPLYAIGIVIYLIYTLTKLFIKKQDKYKYLLNSNPKNYMDVGKNMNMNETRMKNEVINKQKELVNLLWKADQELIADDEMYALKERLKETENQMTRILKAMEAIQQTATLQEHQLDNNLDDYPLENDEMVDSQDYACDNEDVKHSNKDICSADDNMDHSNNNLNMNKNDDAFEDDLSCSLPQEVCEENNKPAVRKRRPCVNENF